MTTKTPTKINDTRDQLRRLMTRHTAATVHPPLVPPAVKATPARNVPSAPEAVREALPEVAPRAEATPQMASPAKKGGVGERCTLRLSGVELSKIDRLILETHQRVGERITVSDVLRIGLARVTAASPIAGSEIALLRASDGRRIKERNE